VLRGQKQCNRAVALAKKVMEKLDHEVKLLLIETLQLEEVAPADIDAQAPLFGEGLGLDSVDALEIAVALKRRYGIKLSPNSQETRKYFASVRTLAELLLMHREGRAIA
jgi:acyl carrier protein